MEKRRRGRRRGGRNGELQSEPALEPREEMVEPQPERRADREARSRFSLFGRKRGDARDDGESGRKKKTPRKETGLAARPVETSPMDFWRSARARSARSHPVQSQPAGPLGIGKRISAIYVPPWAPVVAIIVVVFGILGLLFYTRSAIGSPRIGDHNHAPYAFFVCGEKQPNFREYYTSTGIHTHGDGVIHLHPSNSTGEGAGAAVRRWVEAEGGKLSGSDLRIPQYSTTYKTSDGCGGDPAELRVLRADSGIHPLGGSAPGQSFGEAIAKCDSLPWSAYENVGGRYIPQDGDCIRVVFGPRNSEPVIQADRTILPEEEATRTLELGIDGSEVDTILSPARIDAYAAETIKVVVRNTSVALHGLRFAGTDGQYGTPDDYVTEPPTIEPGQEGTVVIRFDNGGEYEFRDELGNQATGTVTVSAGTAPSPSPTPAPEERFDADVSIEATEDSFAPAEVSADAGQALRITIAASGRFAHNIRVAGPDGEYWTDDDFVSDDILPGETGELIVTLDERGIYEFRCDFHPKVQTGTILIE